MRGRVIGSGDGELGDENHFAVVFELFDRFADVVEGAVMIFLFVGFEFWEPAARHLFE